MGLLGVVKWRGVGVCLEFHCDKVIIGERTEGLEETWRCRCISDSLLAFHPKFHQPEAGTALYADSVPKWSRLLHCLIRKASFILWVHWRSAGGKGRYSLRSSLFWGVTKPRVLVRVEQSTPWTTRRCVTSQKSENLIYTVAVAWNHEVCSALLFNRACS